MTFISFESAFIAIIQIFLMGGVGFFIVRRGLINESGLKVLSWLSINVTFPFFIFFQIVQNFDPQAQAFWWSYPLINISIAAVGLLIAGAVALALKKKESREWVAVSSFHNAGYIPLLLITMLPLGVQTSELYSYVLLTIIGFDLCLWTIGVWLIGYRQHPTISLRNLVNAPLLSMFGAFVLVLIGGKGWIPEIAVKPIKVIGDSALALAMIAIGGNLALTQFKKLQWKSIGGAVMIKLLLLPLIALIVLKVFHIEGAWGLILMIQSCMPTAISLSIIARNYDNPNQDLINQTIFVTHVLCGLTIPLFLGLYSSHG
jgi:malate permease and related proteins